MRNPFQASSEKLQPSDPHDELVRTVDSRCAQLREKCCKMRHIVKHYGDVRREYVNIQSNPNQAPYRTAKR